MKTIPQLVLSNFEFLKSFSNISTNINEYQVISIDIKRKLKKLNLEFTKGPEMVRSKAQVHFDKCKNFNRVEFWYLVLKKSTFQKIFGWNFSAENKQENINWYFCFLDKILEKVKNIKKDLTPHYIWKKSGQFIFLHKGIKDLFLR